LFCFTAYSHAFPHEQFEQKFEPWQLHEQLEWRPDEDAVPERVGCWHPASVIQDAHVTTWAGIVAQLLDREASLSLGASEFTVLEIGDDLPTVTEVEPPFQDVETWETPDSSLAMEVPTKCLDAVKDLCTQADEVETGGILAGTDVEGTTARILRATDPPSDSVQEPTQFHRGSEGVDEWLEEARASMGIHYLGEWHYHPRASPEMSELDRKEMNNIAADEEYACPHPLLLIIGGHASEQFTVNAYLFHRSGEPEELQYMNSQPQDTNEDDSSEDSPDTAASDHSRGDDQ
jgi:integrative and conjugative element protein (TIGR02256 family)